MTLRRKFFVVLTLLGLTLGANVALSIWSIRFLERELVWPMRSSQPVLAGLHTIKRIGEDELVVLNAGRAARGSSPMAEGGGVDPGSASARILEMERRVEQTLESLNDHDAMKFRSGVSTSENLRARSLRIEELVRRWGAGGDPGLGDELIGQIQDRHELIERIEGRLIEDAALANTYGQQLRVLITGIIITSFVGAVLIGVFCVILLRRWVLQPVQRLRDGARRYARGEFGHHIVIGTGDELGQLGDEFSRMASTISAMQEERIERERLAAMGEMAQRTVHNLRTPLAGIRALAETTLSELDDASDLRQVQQRIIETVDRFEGWLQGMLRVSSPLKLEHGAYDPVALVRGVVESHRGAALTRSLRLELSVRGTPAQAVGDRDQLEHAITALLSNAIDFAPEGSEIELSVDSGEDYWTLAVTDHGPGIPDHLRVSIFRPYFTTRKSGTGIGLALVKRIVDQHGGTIEVRSPIGGDQGPGTAFFVRLPSDARDPGSL